MPERATIFQTTQIGVEATPGTAVAALKKLQGISIEPSIKADVKTFRPRGTKFTGLAALGKEWVEAKIEGLAAYNDLTWLFASLMSTPTPAQQGVTTAYKHTFEVKNNAADTVSTLSVEQGYTAGPGGRAHKFDYGLVNELSLEFSRDEIGVSGSMIGRALTDNAQMSTNEQQTLSETGTVSGGTFTMSFGGQTTAAINYDANAAAIQAALEALSSIGAGNVVVTGGPVSTTPAVIEFRQELGQADQGAITVASDNLTGGGTYGIAETTKGAAPTAIVMMPILPTEVSVYMADTYAGLPGSALTRVLKGIWKLGSRFGQLWALNAAEASWAAHIEAEPDMTLTLLMEADAEGMAVLPVLRSGASKFIRIEAVSEVAAGTGYPYKLTLDMCGKVSEVSDFSDEDGVYAIEWTFKGAYDPTWTKAAQVELVNSVSAL